MQLFKVSTGKHYNFSYPALKVTSDGYQQSRLFMYCNFNPGDQAIARIVVHQLYHKNIIPKVSIRALPISSAQCTDFVDHIQFQSNRSHQNYLVRFKSDRNADVTTQWSLTKTATTTFSDTKQPECVLYYIPEV